MAHMVYVFFTHKNAHSSYIPSTLYWDIQIMVSEYDLTHWVLHISDQLQSTPINSEALLHTLTCCVLDSADCATLHCPLYLHPCPCHLFGCLFTFVPWCHVLLALFVYFPFWIVSIVDRQWADVKSDCTHCIRRGLSRRLRSSLLLNSSPRCDPL